MARSTQVIRLNETDDVREAIDRAVESLVAGHTVGLPTETVYGVAAMARSEEAVERLRTIKGRPQEKPLALAVPTGDEALQYSAPMTKVGLRLTRRCWPGPVTLVCPAALQGDTGGGLPASVRQAVAPAGKIGLRVPANAVAREVLRLMPGPLVLTSANRSGQPDAASADQVVDALGDAVGLVLDDGPTRYGRPSTVVELSGGGWTILRAGVVPESTLRWMSGCHILFVCTGNTCRSPMAEGLCRKMLSEQVGCGPDDLAFQGWHVVSGGLAAAAGGRPTAEAVEVAAGRGVNLNDHISQPLSYQLAAYSDYVFTMTRQHRDAIVAQWPEMAERVRLLAVDGSDIPDPIGAGVDAYHRCADAIEQHLRALLPTLDEG